ncbi:MAG TPA: hypothetical protein VGL91_24320, partial [Acidobacteriota bacterium]
GKIGSVQSSGNFVAPLQDAQVDIGELDRGRRAKNALCPRLYSSTPSASIANQIFAARKEFRAAGRVGLLTLPTDFLAAFRHRNDVDRRKNSRYFNHSPPAKSLYPIVSIGLSSHAVYHILPLPCGSKIMHHWVFSCVISIRGKPPTEGENRW